MIRRHLVNDALTRPCRGETAAAENKSCGVFRHGGDIGGGQIGVKKAKKPPGSAAFSTDHVCRLADSAIGRHQPVTVAILLDESDRSEWEVIADHRKLLHNGHVVEPLAGRHRCFGVVIEHNPTVRIFDEHLGASAMSP